ncbi:MAG: hypothetical protein K2Y37_09355 [Pirellulales bacterium]|nr:hypothetical protein [Pirellulales bacterium]
MTIGFGGLQRIATLRAHLTGETVSALTLSRFTVFRIVAIALVVLGGLAIVAGVAGWRASRRVR